MKKLKDYRLKLGMTMKQVAQKLDITESSVCLHENGARTPNIEILQRYAQWFNCKVDDLLDAEEG